MKNTLILLISIGVNLAYANSPELVDVNLSTSFVPIGFDDNDRTQVVVAGQFADTCYQVGPHQIQIDQANKEIFVNQKAYLYKGQCLDVIVPFSVTINLDLLEKGQYRIIDGLSKRKLGVMPVTQATSDGVGSDEFPYAPVNEAFVLKNGASGGHDLILRGTFTNRCMRFKRIEVKYQGNVIVVLPIVEKVQGRCENRLVSFEKRVPLKDLGEKAYLFHVRSMDGQAINKLYMGITN